MINRSLIGAKDSSNLDLNKERLSKRREPKMIVVRVDGIINEEQAGAIRNKIKKQIEDDGIIVHGRGIEIELIPDGDYDVEVNGNEQKPLLTIELQDENSAPIVYYKGERKKYLESVSLDWETARDHGISNLDYEVTRHVKGFKKEIIGLVTEYDE